MIDDDRDSVILEKEERLNSGSAVSMTKLDSLLRSFLALGNDDHYYL
ncbi:hypothetical protein K08M4_13900 [Vibrio syngnathi]|uniref:Uncharacterized protein n=1 Tax=Vibrio syngnathi TaxID=3034029 RepID=A0AA34TNL3_9VIBR|nr:hypothetical protein K08M4_13900 [Vibrio syngnathi]